MRWNIRWAFLRIDACLGLGAALYIGVMTIRGSALIFHPELYRAQAPRVLLAVVGNWLKTGKDAQMERGRI
jgi:hypothetical protein